MPRPSRSKRVCRMPSYCRFHSVTEETINVKQIRMSIEEFETIRLIDYIGMTQQECARQMQVARTTVQRLYQDARRKMARFLVEGTVFSIEGGDIEVCQECGPQMQTIECSRLAMGLYRRKGGYMDMKLAVTYDAETGEIFQHFGHTETFKFYELNHGEIVKEQIVSTNGTGHGALAGLLAEDGITVLICGGIGGGARNALAEAGIEVYPGAAGDADTNVKSFLAGVLSYDPDTMCSHHGAEHTCGGHKDGGCGH